MWVEIRRKAGEDPEKLAEALRCAEAMDAWARKLGKKVMVLTREES